MTPAKARVITEAAHAQLDWMDEHGGSLAGYVTRYGESGAYIYAADNDRLRAILGRLRASQA